MSIHIMTRCSTKIFRSGKGQSFFCLLYLWITLFNLFVTTESLHLSGTWNSKDFFLFLAKFGFQKTDPKELSNTQGYIYGNISFIDSGDTDTALDRSLSLVVVDSEYFLEFYGNRTLDSSKACPAMFNKIDSIAFDYVCKQHGKEDFLRRVPCPKNKLCVDEDNPKNVVPGYQFSYKVQDVQRPRFWYLSIVSCYREKKTCLWKSSTDPSFAIAYDIWMVNGNPSVKGVNPFEHQFSFENHDVFEIHLAAFLVTVILFLLWLYAFSKQKHIITKVFTVSLCVEMGSIFCYLIHISVFAFNGVGVNWLGSIGRLLDQASQCIFMLLLLLIAKGLGITTDQFKWRSVIFSMWAAYSLLNFFLYIWNLVEIDIIISNTDEWQTWPGYATLIFRLVVMLWFFYELRQTYGMTSRNDITFVQHFGAFFLVWFCYLPALAFITTQVSPLWRYKTIISISYAVNCLANAVIIYLLWPAQSILYLVEGERPLPIYDLEITGLLEDMNETVLFNREEIELESCPRENESLDDADKTKTKGSESLRNRNITNNGSKGLNGHLEFYNNETPDTDEREKEDERKMPGEK